MLITPQYGYVTHEKNVSHAVTTFNVMNEQIAPYCFEELLTYM